MVITFVSVLNTQDRSELKPGKDLLLCPAEELPFYHRGQ